MDSSSSTFAAVLIGADGIECRMVPRIDDGADLHAAGTIYVDCAGTFVCGFHSSLCLGTKIVGCEVRLFPGLESKWSVLRNLPGVYFKSDRVVWVVWVSVPPEELVCAGEEWFLFCALFQASDRYCVLVDFPPPGNDNVVCTPCEQG